MSRQYSTNNNKNNNLWRCINCHCVIILLASAAVALVPLPSAAAAATSAADVNDVDNAGRATAGDAGTNGGRQSEVEESVTINKPVTRRLGDRQEPWDHFSADNVRCFCNLPVCVSTGYMCKSKEGSCFSDFHENVSLRPSQVYRGRHGCVELLTEGSKKSQCQKRTNDNSATAYVHENRRPKNLLVCCYHDMCNHIDSPQTKHFLLNNTVTGGRPDKPNKVLAVAGPQQDLGYASPEVWFKAATIAVPICGAVILFVLIALAVKILRNENQNSSNRKLGPVYVQHSSQSKLHRGDKHPNEIDQILRIPSHSSRENSYFLGHGGDQVHVQVPLLVQNDISSHCGSKNETNAKLNLLKCESVGQLMESGKCLMLAIEKESEPKCSQVNLDMSEEGEKYPQDKYQYQYHDQ